MALQYSVNVRNAKLDQIETTIGTSPILELRSGAAPANCAAAPSGSLLAQSAAPADWLAAAAAGVKARSGSAWTATGVGTGTIGHFRIYESGSPSLCHMQGSVTITGGGGDMTVDNTSITPAQVVTVDTFAITDNNG